MSAILDLLKNFSSYNNLTFWRQVFLYTQQSQGNELSDCITTFDNFKTLVDDVSKSTASSAEYYAGLALKGQGSGSLAGFYFDNFQQYIDVYIDAVNVFNYCDINYYMRAFGKWFSASGGVNQAINTFWRFISTDDMQQYYDLSVAMMQKNPTNAGKAFGKWFAVFMQVEIPDTTSTPSY